MNVVYSSHLNHEKSSMKCLKLVVSETDKSIEGRDGDGGLEERAAGLDKKDCVDTAIILGPLEELAQLRPIQRSVNSLTH